MVEKYRDRGLVVLAIDKGDEAAAVKSFQSQGNLRQTFLLDGDDVAREYGVERYPRTIFIDRQGTIQEIVQGFAPSMRPRMESRIQSLLSS